MIDIMCGKKVRIAQVIGKMWAGGVESVVFNYYRKLDKDKFTVDFYYDFDSTIEPPKELLEMGAKFYKIPPYQKIHRYVPTLFKYFKRNEYDIVHSHINTLSVIPLFVAWLAGIKVRIAHNHSVPAGQEIRRNIVKGILKITSTWFSTEYFACSKKAAIWLFGKKNYDSGKTKIIYNAIDVSEFSSQNFCREELRKEFGLTDEVVVGHVGRFTYAKNHKFLIDIFKSYIELNSNAKLLLVGDGELRNEIEQSIKGKHLSADVIMTGSQSDVAKYYSVIDVLCVPSIYEGLSLISIEAQFMSVPIIISKAVPKDALISNGYMYCNIEEDPSVWAKGIDNILNREFRLTDKSNEYNIKNACEKLETYYSSFLCDYN